MFVLIFWIYFSLTYAVDLNNIKNIQPCPQHSLNGNFDPYKTNLKIGSTPIPTQAEISNFWKRVLNPSPVVQNQGNRFINSGPSPSSFNFNLNRAINKFIDTVLPSRNQNTYLNQGPLKTFDQIRKGNEGRYSSVLKNENQFPQIPDSNKKNWINGLDSEKHSEEDNYSRRGYSKNPFTFLMQLLLPKRYKESPYGNLKQNGNTAAYSDGKLINSFNPNWQKNYPTQINSKDNENFNFLTNFHVQNDLSVAPTFGIDRSIDGFYSTNQKSPSDVYSKDRENQENVGNKQKDDKSFISKVSEFLKNTGTECHAPKKLNHAPDSTPSKEKVDQLLNKEDPHFYNSHEKNISPSLEKPISPFSNKTGEHGIVPSDPLESKFTNSASPTVATSKQPHNSKHGDVNSHIYPSISVPNTKLQTSIPNRQKSPNGNVHRGIINPDGEIKTEKFPNMQTSNQEKNPINQKFARVKSSMNPIEQEIADIFTRSEVKPTIPSYGQKLWAIPTFQINGQSPSNQKNLEMNSYPNQQFENSHKDDSYPGSHPNVWPNFSPTRGASSYNWFPIATWNKNNFQWKPRPTFNPTPSTPTDVEIKYLYRKIAELKNDLEQCQRNNVAIHSNNEYVAYENGKFMRSFLDILREALVPVENFSKFAGTPFPGTSVNTWKADKVPPKAVQSVGSSKNGGTDKTSSTISTTGNRNDGSNQRNRNQETQSVSNKKSETSVTSNKCLNRGNLNYQAQNKKDIQLLFLKLWEDTINQSDPKEVLNFRKDSQFRHPRMWVDVSHVYNNNKNISINSPMLHKIFPIDDFGKKRHLNFRDLPLLYSLISGTGVAYQIDKKDFTINRINPPEIRIIGGESVSINKYPYQVAIMKNNDFTCGGAIIGPKYVLTAAHCFEGNSNEAALYSVKAGCTTLSNHGQIRNVTKIIRHKKYVFSDNDIALLMVNPPFEFGPTVGPVKLPSLDSCLKVGDQVTITGYGNTGGLTGMLNQDLFAVMLKLTSRDNCKSRKLKTVASVSITERQICTTSPIDKGTCYGDSGGPMVHDGQLVGIVSWGSPCAIGDPDVYTNVYNFVSWIADSIRKMEE